MHWILRTLFLSILGILATAVFAPGLVGALRGQVLGSSQEPVKKASQDHSPVLKTVADDLAPSMNPEDSDRPGIQMSPIFDGLIQLGNQIADVSDQNLNVDKTLNDAARQLSETKQRNKAAIRDLNRPYRRVSPGAPHLLLITVSGLTNEDISARHLESTDSTLSTMYQHGIRFVQYYSPRSRDRAWYEFQTGNLLNTRSDSATSLIEPIWKSGYLTALVGDCTQGPRVLGPSQKNYDYHFGITETQDRDRNDLTVFESNGQPIEVLLEGEHLETQDYYLNQAASYFASHRRGRPIFVHLALALQEGADHESQVRKLDQRLKRLMKFVEAQSLQSELVITLAALGTTTSTEQGLSGPVAEQAPLLMYRPDRVMGKSTDFLCGTCDLLPTIAEWTRAAVVHGRDGVSLKPGMLDERYSGDRSLIWLKTTSNQETVVAKSPWQLILGNPVQLFDTLRDPEKSANLAQQLPQVRESLSNLVIVEH
jgi:hypothetical protein